MVGGGEPAARRSAPPTLAQRLQELGPLYAKIGQYLALRPDILDRHETDELLLLTDVAPPAPWVQVRERFLADFGQAPEELFDWINPSPRAAGALAQVYTARTADGDEVAVKVLRPDVAPTLERELKNLEKVLKIVDDTCDLGPDGCKHLEEDVRSWLGDQMDLGREYRNALRLHQTEVKDQRFRFPEPYGEYSSPTVFTAEYLRGVPFTVLLGKSARGRRGRIADLGLDRYDLADNVVESLLQQVFTLGLFHAAPHPANLVALPDDEIGLVGLGFVDRIDSVERDRQLALISALDTEDTERAVRALIDGLQGPDQFRVDEFRADLLDKLRGFRREEEISGELALPHHLRAVLQLARKYDIKVPHEMASFYCALLTAESVAQMLSPGSGLGQVGAPFFLRLQVRTAVHKLSFNESRALGFDLLDLLTSAPGNIGRLLADLADDRFVFRVATSEAEEDRRTGHARARLISLSIVLVAVAVLVSGPDMANTAGRVIGYGLLAVLSVVLAVLWRRLR
jgi:ubiquinone biosynthesis protein